MLSTHLPTRLLFLLVPLAWTQNITISFASNQAETCEASSQSPGFTTWVIPAGDGYAGLGGCYNLDDIFADNFPFFSTTPYPNSTQQVAADPNNLNGSTFNSHDYDSQTNYSQLWYQQTTQVTRQESDRLASRELMVYSERDCVQGKGFPPREIGAAPYFGQNCRSTEEGKCYQLSERIVSFSINSVESFYKAEGRKKCWEAKVMGAAASVHAKGFGAFVIGFAVTIVLLL